MFKFFRKKQRNLSVREAVFGLEDGLVSTLGAIVGIAVGTNNTPVIILSGLVILAVESLSMGAGSFLSNETAEMIHERSEKKARRESIRAGMVMIAAYLVGGFVPLISYFFLPPSQAVLLSVAMTVVALSGVGFWAGRVSGRNPWKTSVEMVVVSISAAAVGYLIGRGVSMFFGIDIPT